jgi:hypothetical protein
MPKPYPVDLQAPANHRAAVQLDLHGNDAQL